MLLVKNFHPSLFDCFATAKSIWIYESYLGQWEEIWLIQSLRFEFLQCMFGPFDKYCTHGHTTQLPGIQNLQEHITYCQFKLLYRVNKEPCTVNLTRSLGADRLWVTGSGVNRDKPIVDLYVDTGKSSERPQFDCSPKHAYGAWTGRRVTHEGTMWHFLLFWQHWLCPSGDEETKLGLFLSVRLSLRNMKTRGRLLNALTALKTNI